MDRRLSLALVTIGSTLGLLAPALTAPAAATPRVPRDIIPSTPVTWCTSSSAPCIQSVLHDGSNITSADSTWDVSGSYFTLDGATEVQWSIDKPGAAVHDPSTGEDYASLGAGDIGHTWSINFDLGDTFIPRVTGTYADDVLVDRVHHDDGTYNVVLTGTTVKQAANAECDTSGDRAVCPVQSSADIAAFQGEISDFGQWTDASQRADFYGLDSWTNVEVTYAPPTVSGDPLVIEAPLANSYKFSNGDVVQGFYHVIIPNHFLQDMGIDDPSTLDPAGVDVHVGTGTVGVTPGASSTEVDATGVTFAPPPTPPAARSAQPNAKHASNRTLKVKRGTITPGKPTKVKAQRSGAKAKVTFAKAKAKGSKIVGYQARCVAHHNATLTAKSKHSPAKVKQLASGVTYACQVRAKSKAGYGHWSAKDRA